MPIDIIEMLSRPKVVVGGRASAMIPRNREPPQEQESPEKADRDYAKQFIKQEQEKYRSFTSHSKSASEEDRPSAMSDMETVTHSLSEVVIDDLEKKLNVYDNYSFEAVKPSLPINRYRTKIIDMIEIYKVIIIKGSTGCGKTTQIPQFILDDAREKRTRCNIIITQPRRLAAITVAKRVCKERNWDLGLIVGYQVGQNRKACDDTCITYCTTGVLLQKLVQAKNMSTYTHIILDEVHERDADMDFLMILVRKFLNTNSRQVKVILMSATISTDKFSEYFYSVHSDKTVFAPVFEMKDEKMYPVTISYLNNYYSRIPDAKCMRSTDDPDINKNGYATAVAIVVAIEQLEKEVEAKKQKSLKGSVLVFLPGLYEIEEMTKQLEDHEDKTKEKYDWWIIPLHSSITTEEQDLVFGNPPPNHRKIILSTNIAESSITVPDVQYVIDFCLTKIICIDHKTNLSTLKMCWASKNSLKQRAGRVGRVMEGRVYRLIKEEFYADLEEETTPEMLRSSLDHLVLQAKLLDQGSPKAVFALALDPPDLRNIEQTVLTLKEIGALMVTTAPVESKGREPITIREPAIDECDGDLTYLGRTIARLPMDVRLGKLIFFGDMFNVLEECIIMACAMSVKNIFSTPFKDYLRAYNSKLAWANSTCSDSIAFLNAYTVWRKKRLGGLFRKKETEIKWCRDRFLQPKLLNEISILHGDVLARLKSCNLITHSGSGSTLDAAQKNLFLKLALAAAFYPNYFLRGFLSGQVDEKEAVAMVGGHDPFSTVYLQGMPINQPAVLYKKSIEKHFQEVSSRVNIKFDAGSKIFVNFGYSVTESIEGNMLQIPGKIDLAVYRAVKMRQLNAEIRIPIWTIEEANARVENYLKEYKNRKLLMKDTTYVETLLPWPWNKNLEQTEIVEISVSHVETPSRFWAISTFRMAKEIICNIAELLPVPGNVIPVQEDIRIGRIYVIEIIKSRTPQFYRCRVLAYKYSNDTYDVLLIDYGEIKTGLKKDEIKTFNQELLKENHFDKIPGLAMEFSLAKVQPATVCEGRWTSGAIQFFNHLVQDKNPKKRFVAKIYSVIDDIVKVKLYHCEQDTALENISINEVLVQKNYAEKAEEPLLSRLDHLERKNWKKMAETSEEKLSIKRRNLTEKEQIIEQLTELDIVDTPQKTMMQAVLRGPFSPLEMKIFSAKKSSLPKEAIIERNSVNSVLLDANPMDEYERMVVAGFVTINPASSRLSLKDTTIMPNLPGLPAIICMLFSPMVELRCDAEYTKFTGALCGLGYDAKTGKSLNPDSDIEIVFDVEITLDSVLVINKIRYWMNRALGFGNQTELDKTEFHECQRKLTTYISELIWRKWTPQELCYNTQNYQWNLINPKTLLSPCQDDHRDFFRSPADDHSCVYRLIWGIDLNGDIGPRKKKVLENLQILKEFASGLKYIKNFECILCQNVIPNRNSAKLHIKSGLHRARAQKYLKIVSEVSDCGSEMTLTNYSC